MHKQYSEEGTRFVELSYEVRYLVKIIKRLSTTKKKKTKEYFGSFAQNANLYKPTRLK